MMSTMRCGNDKNYGIDRISSLPDDVLTYILSFLSTRKTVQTCILSKRWINIWASVPVLEFDIKEFGLMPDIIFGKMDVELVTKFKLLVKSVLEKRERSCVINRIRFWLDFVLDLPCTHAVADCISYAMKLEPRECSVVLHYCGNLNLIPDLIFTCASLIDLQLWLFINVKAFEPNSINLPCLKTLDLTGHVTISEDFFKKILLGCPVLEELLLSCRMGIIEIYSNTLKKLVIHEQGEALENRLQISTPNLLYFEIDMMDRGEIILLNMSSLVDAVISVPGWDDHDDYITGVPKHISSFSNLEA